MKIRSKSTGSLLKQLFTMRHILIIQESDIDCFYAEKEKRNDSAKFIVENNKETLAQGLY